MLRKKRRKVSGEFQQAGKNESESMNFWDLAIELFGAVFALSFAVAVVTTLVTFKQRLHLSDSKIDKALYEPKKRRTA